MRQYAAQHVSSPPDWWAETRKTEGEVLSASILSHTWGQIERTEKTRIYNAIRWCMMPLLPGWTAQVVSWGGKFKSSAFEKQYGCKFALPGNRLRQHAGRVPDRTNDSRRIEHDVITENGKVITVAEARHGQHDAETHARGYTAAAQLLVRSD